MNKHEKLCPKSKKRMFTSANAARRSGKQRYGTLCGAYLCKHCNRWHITRQDADPHVELLAQAVLGTGGES